METISHRSCVRPLYDKGLIFKEKAVDLIKMDHVEDDGINTWEKKDNDKDKRYEITLSGGHLNRTCEEIVCTLLHELVHLHCSLNNIVDTSNNHVYHNKRFKEEAEKHGLIIEKGQTVGWSYSTLNEKAKDFVEKLKIDSKTFDYWRNAFSYELEKKKSVAFKYECECGIKLRLTKRHNLICGECNKKFEEIED